jgi:hypothetical protein
MIIAAGSVLYIFVGILVIRLLVKFSRTKYSYFDDDPMVMGLFVLMWPAWVIFYVLVSLILGLGKLATPKS